MADYSIAERYLFLRVAKNVQEMNDKQTQMYSIIFEIDIVRDVEDEKARC